MSPISTAIESFAATHGVPVLEAQEFWLELCSIREYEGGLSRQEAEAAALEDLGVWARLWKSVKQ